MIIQALELRTDLWKGGAPKELRLGQPCDHRSHIFKVKLLASTVNPVLISVNWLKF